MAAVKRSPLPTQQLPGLSAMPHDLRADWPPNTSRNAVRANPDVIPLFAEDRVRRFGHASAESLQTHVCGGAPNFDATCTCVPASAAANALPVQACGVAPATPFPYSSGGGCPGSAASLLKHAIVRRWCPNHARLHVETWLWRWMRQRCRQTCETARTYTVCIER